MSEKRKLICYTDGSSQPNPGFAGYGLYGYIYKESKKPRNINYPVKTNYKYTSKGIYHVQDLVNTELASESIEVISIVEYIGSINSESATNNQGEVMGLTTALRYADTLDDISEVLVITDSKYAIEGFEKGLRNWANNGWKTSSGSTVKNITMWKDLLELEERLKEKKIKIKTKWVKGHENDEGNIVADMYALIGMNFARNQLDDIIEDDFHECCLSSVTSMADFKKELLDRHHILEHKSAIFNTGQAQEDCFMLVSTYNPFTELDIGKRDLFATYSLMLGGAPSGLAGLKSRFSRMKRLFDTTAMINLDILKKDKLLTRVINIVGFDPIVVRYQDRGLNKFMAFDKDGVIVEELPPNYTHLHEVYQTFDRLNYALSNYQNQLDTLTVDITHLLIENYDDPKKRSLTIDYRTKVLDLTDKVSFKDIVMVSKLKLQVGMDTPKFPVLKDLLPNIKKIYLYPDVEFNRNLMTLSFIIEYEDKSRTNYMATTNLLSKYLVKA